jgi:hypothetical protein
MFFINVNVKEVFKRAATKESLSFFLKYFLFVTFFYIYSIKVPGFVKLLSIKESPRPEKASSYIRRCVQKIYRRGPPFFSVVLFGSNPTPLPAAGTAKLYQR